MSEVLIKLNKNFINASDIFKRKILNFKSRLFIFRTPYAKFGGNVPNRFLNNMGTTWLTYAQGYGEA